MPRAPKRTGYHRPRKSVVQGKCTPDNPLAHRPNIWRKPRFRRYHADPLYPPPLLVLRG